MTPTYVERATVLVVKYLARIEAAQEFLQTNEFTLLTDTFDDLRATLLTYANLYGKSEDDAQDPYRELTEHLHKLIIMPYIIACDSRLEKIDEIYSTDKRGRALVKDFFCGLHFVHKKRSRAARSKITEAKNLRNTGFTDTFQNPMLFSIGWELQEDLENGNFSEQLRQQFTNNNITLHQNVTIRVKEGQDTWEIHDEDGSILYVIKKEDYNLTMLN